MVIIWPRPVTRWTQTVTQTEIRQVLDVTKIEQWQPLVTKLKFPFLVSKIPPIPFCTVDRRSRNKFRRGVKSTKFAIAGAKRKKRNFIEICHTQVEITASKFPMAAIRNSGQPQVSNARQPPALANFMNVNVNVKSMTLT